MGLESGREGLRFDLGQTCVGLLLLLLLLGMRVRLLGERLREACRPTQAHAQVGHVGQVKVHVEGVWSEGLVVAEELVHVGHTVPPRLLLLLQAVGQGGQRHLGQIPVQLTLGLRK